MKLNKNLIKLMILNQKLMIEKVNQNHKKENY